MKWINMDDLQPEIGQEIIGLWHYPEGGPYSENVASWTYGENNGNLRYWMCLPEKPED